MSDSNKNTWVKPTLITLLVVFVVLAGARFIFPEFSGGYGGMRGHYMNYGDRMRDGGNCEKGGGKGCQGQGGYQSDETETKDN